MRKNRRRLQLRDAYRFTGFRPGCWVRGVFGDPRGRVIALSRRSKPPLDYAKSLHELLNRPTRELLGDRVTGIFHSAWLIPGIAAGLVFALSFLRFFFHLPARTRFLVLVAATVVTGGAMGVESVGSAYAERHGISNLTYSMIATVEESLEMAGVIVFIYALLKYIEDNDGEVQLRFGNPEKNPLSTGGTE